VPYSLLASALTVAFARNEGYVLPIATCHERATHQRCRGRYRGSSNLQCKTTRPRIWNVLYPLAWYDRPRTEIQTFLGWKQVSYTRVHTPGMNRSHLDYHSAPHTPTRGCMISRYDLPLARPCPQSACHFGTKPSFTTSDFVFRWITSGAGM
jgi:hypothetical protein